MLCIWRLPADTDYKKINTEKILVLWGLSGKKKAVQIRDGPATPSGAAGPDLHMAQAMLRTAKNYLPPLRPKLLL
jgi:hypothetical protein